MLPGAGSFQHHLPDSWGFSLDDSICQKSLKNFREDSTMTISFSSIQTRLLPLVTKAPHCKANGVISSKFQLQREIHASIKLLTLVPLTRH